MVCAKVPNESLALSLESFMQEEKYFKKSAPQTISLLAVARCSHNFVHNVKNGIPDEALQNTGQHFNI